MAKQEPKTTGKKPRKCQLDKERELARLYYFHGDSQKAIAERLGVSPQTVNRWVKDWTADEIIKAAKAVKTLDENTNVVTIMEVFASFGNWLAARMQIDPELTPETVHVITKYQDIYISEMMSQSKVNLS